MLNKLYISLNCISTIALPIFLIIRNISVFILNNYSTAAGYFVQNSIFLGVLKFSEYVLQNDKLCKLKYFYGKKIHNRRVFTVIRIILYYHEVPTLILFNYIVT